MKPKAPGCFSGWASRKEVLFLFRAGVLPRNFLFTVSHLLDQYNSLVLGLQKLGICVASVHLVHWAFLLKEILSTAGLRGTLWILSLASPLSLSSQFPPLFLGSQ